MSVHAREAVTILATEPRLHIRLLGEQELTVAGARLTLPPSKKTRALLGYLALSERKHRRERLCTLLWDVADDPRAALRWSLSKLRELVDRDGEPRLIADREHVRLDLSGAWLDVAEARKVARANLAELDTEALEGALSLFRGELLEGLEMADFHAYHAFCVGEREALRDLHARIVAELLERRAGKPEQALPLARRLVELDPASEPARARFMQLLAASGREREALVETQKTRRLLARDEAGEPAQPPPPVEVPPQRDSLLLAAPQPMVGRARELDRLTRGAARCDGGARVLLITGAPGLGKSCLLQQLMRASALEGRGLVFEGAAREVDLGVPYEPLRALLRASAALAPDDDAVPSVQRAGASLAVARASLFQRVSAWLSDAMRAQEPPARALIAIEDLHWLDEGSAQLLHQLVVTCRALPLCVVATARAGELADNAPVRRLLRALRAEGVLEELPLAPLTRDETATLVHAVSHALDPSLARSPARIDVDDVYAESGGNPLFALALARSPSRDGELSPVRAVPPSITQLVRERMEVLTSEQTELLRWASVLGESFRAEALAPLLAHEPTALVEALEQLDRLGWIVLSTVDADAAHFAHAIVHRAVYDALSGPRRRLMHARVAHQLAQYADDEPRVAALAHHAVLGGDAEMAVTACLAAARRCLKLFAAGEALALARRGLEHVFGLPQVQRCRLEIDLRELVMLARTSEWDAEMSARLTVLAREALALEQVDHARRCFYMQAILVWEDGRANDAAHFSSESERCSRLGTPRERLQGLADAARCLCLLERELTEAQAFVLEAEALIAAGEPEVGPVWLARGLLDSLRGEWDAAEAALARAHTLSSHEGDHFAGFMALEFQLEVALAQDRWEAARPFAEALVALAARIREGSEQAFAHAMLALVRFGQGEVEGGALEHALGELRAADSKRRMAYVLARWAELLLARGELTNARKRAEEALTLARAVESSTEEVLARSVLVQSITDDAVQVAAQRAALEALTPALLSARARGALARLPGLEPSKSPRSARAQVAARGSATARENRSQPRPKGGAF